MAPPAKGVKMSFTIREFGNLLLVDNNGERSFAYPAASGLWIVSAGTETPPPGSDFQWPFDPATISSRYRTADRPTHDGLDFSYGGIEGDPIPSIGAGTVSVVSNGSGTGYGNFVRVEHGVVGGQSVQSLYAHMQTFPPVSVGQVVARGETLGPAGNTGNSFGAHLHLEIRLDGVYVDPEIWLTANV